MSEKSGRRKTAAVATNSFCEITENMALLHAASLHDGQQTRCGEFSGITAVPEGDLSPLDGCPQGSLDGIVGRFDSVVFQEHKQPLEIEEQRPGEIAHVPIRVVHVGVCQSEELPL